MGYIYSSTEAKWDRMELLQKHTEGYLTMQEKVRELSHYMKMSDLISDISYFILLTFSAKHPANMIYMPKKHDEQYIFQPFSIFL
jgi:hypothetical protein